MKDGIAQQVDTPKNLYDNPKNLFVAGFMGSPQMNFIDAEVTQSGADVVLLFGQSSIVVPESKARMLIEGGYINKTVIMGVRPEDFHDEEVFIDARPEASIEVTIRLYEMLGAEVFLYFDVDKYSCTARVNPRTTARPGDTIRMAIDTSKIHIFDKETQLVIAN